MKRYALLLLLLLSSTPFAAPSPVGLWLATSPFFGTRPLAIVKTYLINEKLCGETVKIIPLKGAFITPVKMAASGPVMMCDFHEDNGKWIDGHIYEQTTAKIYPSSLTISDDGEHLYVRGWIGIFFRTAKWDRIK